MSRLICTMLLMAACGEAERGADAAAGGDAETRDSQIAGGEVEVTDEGDVPDGDAGVEGDTEEAAPEVEPDITPDTSPDVAPDGAGDVAPEADATPTDGWRWETGPTLPSIVQENAVVSAGDAIWVLGGFENLSLVDSVRVLPRGGSSWADGPSLPRPLHHLNAAVVDDTVFVLGALEGFGFSATGDAWRLSTAEDSPAWEPVTPIPGARRRGSSGVAVVGTDVYVIGGFRNNAVAEVDVFDAADPTAPAAWRSVADLPGARDHGGAATIAGRVYYVGGRQRDISAVRGDLWVFDPAAPELGWVSLEPMPTPRGGIVVAAYSGLLVVAGGEGNPDVPSGVFAEVEAYDPVAERWQTLPEMKTPRHGTGAIAFDGALWVPGGADVQAFGAAAVVEYLIRD